MSLYKEYIKEIDEIYAEAEKYGLDKKFLEVLKSNLPVGQLSKIIITTEGIHSIIGLINTSS